MMKNRVISYLILMVMILSVFIAVPTFAAYSDNVLLEYDFENYTGSAPSKDDEKGVTLASLPSQNQSKKLFSRTEGGNTYLYTDYAATKKLYEDAGSTFSWGNVGFQLKFDETFTAGKYAVSFDFAMKEDALPEGDLKSFMMRTAVKRVDDKYAYLFAANADNAKVYGYKSNANEMFDTAGTYGGPVSITPGQVSRVDIVFDLDSKYSEESDANGVVSGYVDGQLFTRKEFTDGLYSNNLNFYLLQEVAYFDNLKVAKVTDDSFEATVTPGMGKVDISFTESVQADIFENAYILNPVTGDEIEITEVKENLPKMSYTLLFDGEIMNGAEYAVVTEKPVENFCGAELSKPITFSTANVGKYVKSVKLVDYKGNEYYAGAELVPEIKVIKVYYTGMEASDEPGSTVELICESAPLGGSGVYNPAEQCLTYTLDEYLIGEKEYKLSINDALLDETYADVEFSTKEGSISIDKFTFTKTVVNEGVPTTEQVESLADLSHGDVIDLEIEIIKTTGEAKNMSLSYSAWASGFMKGFDFKDVSMTADKTYIKNKITSITISKDSTLTLDTIKGFLWTALGSNNPLAEEIVLD